jgi:hypothetical protein
VDFDGGAGRDGSGFTTVGTGAGVSALRGGGVLGDAVDQFVDHQLAAAAGVVVGGVGVPGERGVDGDALRDGEQGGQVGHGVGGGADADPPFGGGFAVSPGAAGGVDALGDAGGRGRSFLVAHRAQSPGEFGVDGGAVGGGQAGGFPGEQRGPPFADLPGA